MSARYPIWLKELSQARDADLLIIPRKAAPAGPLFIESWATRGKARFVYDFDDAIFHDERAFYKRLLDPPSRCKNLCERAALVITGNDYLAQWAEPHSRRVEVIPTTVDTQTHRPRAQKTHSRLPVIGWCGSRTTAQYLVELLPTLREVQQEHPFEILVVGAEIELGDIRGRCVPWSSASEVALLQKMDIGLMPLRAGAWEQGKCALKALLYGAVGIPSVVSKVGANVQAVVHGQTGFHAASLAEWKVFLLRLLENEQEREALGQQARIHIEANYSAQRWVPELGQALRSCL